MPCELSEAPSCEKSCKDAYVAVRLTISSIYVLHCLLFLVQADVYWLRLCHLGQPRLQGVPRQGNAIHSY